MKKFILILLALPLMSLTFTFDKETDDILGKWKLIDYGSRSNTQQLIFNLAFDETETTFHFKKDGTFTMESEILEEEQCHWTLTEYFPLLVIYGTDAEIGKIYKVHMFMDYMIWEKVAKKYSTKTYLVFDKK